MTWYLTQSHYPDTEPTSPCPILKMPIALSAVLSYSWNYQSFTWSFNVFNYIQTGNALTYIYIYTLGRYNGHRELTATSVMRNSVPRAGIEPAYLTFQASVLTIT